MSINPVVVVGSDFCVPYPISFTLVRKAVFIGQGGYQVNDANGNLMFNVKATPISFHNTRVILDAAGTPIVTLRDKKLTAHSRWQAFRGESKDDKDKIFDAKTSSYIQFSTKLHVFLANNGSNEEVPDYTVNGKSCEIYSGNSSTLLAQMERKSKFIGNDKLVVTMNPNVDSAFIVSLTVIFDEIRQANKRAATANIHHHHHTANIHHHHHT